MEILTVLMTSVTVSSLVPHLLEALVSPMATLFSVVPKKLPAKVCTASFTQKLDRLWQEVVSMLRSHYRGQYDSHLLLVLAPLLQATFLHARRSVKNQTVQMWNATFGAGSAPLTYPTDLQGVLVKMKEKTQLSLPGWSAVDVALIDETPVSQMSQMDSQAPEPLLPGMPSPVRLRGSFLNRDVSPKGTPKSPSPKRVPSASENKKATPSARKRLPLECLPQKDFVVITGTPKRRRVLTEHQKEVLKEKRVLPAMYNNLEASQDVSLMAHFSSENTQQDSILDRPTVDDVIVVNSSQSQGLPDPEPVSTAQPSQEKPEEPVLRRSSRRASVRFQEAREESQSSDLPAKKTSEESPVVVSSPENPRRETKVQDQNSELAGKKVTEENPEVIILTESSSQDMLHSQPTGKSQSLPTPQPNLLADTAEKLIDSSSSKDASQSEIPPSVESSAEKRETRSAVRLSVGDRRSFSASLDLTHGTERRRSGLMRRTQSQETKSPQETGDKKKPTEKNPYTIFKNWLKKSPTEEQRKEDPCVSEKSACEEEKALGEPVVVLEKQAKDDCILVEETSASHDTEITITDDTSVDNFSKKTSKITSRAGTNRRSTRRSSQIVEQPVVIHSNSPVDSEHSTSRASSFDMDIPAQHARFKLPPPMVCDEVASQGFPGDTDSAQTSPTESLGQRRPKRKRKGSVDDSTDHSHQEASSSLNKPSAFGFSGILKQNQELESQKEKETDSVEENKKSAPVCRQSPVRETFDPLLNPTLRLTPLPRRSLRAHISDTPDDGTDSEKLAGSAEDKRNGTQSSTPDVLTDDSPATFDPTKDSTLSEQTERSRKRKQQMPKKIADPSLLRRTPRSRRHKPNCSCCKAKPGSNGQDSTDQAKKPNRKRSRGELSSPNGSQSKVSQEKSSQNGQQSDDSKSSKTAQKDTAGEGSIKKHVSLSPQDVGEVTPEAKTSCTPLRQSTTERKKTVAKLKAASKLLGPSLDGVPSSDSESSPLVSQSSTKPQKWKKDVFDSKKEQKKDEDMTAFVYCARTEVSPTTTVVMESPLKNVLKEDTSGLKQKKSGVMFNTKVRSPPKLRLRQKKMAASVETQSDGKTLDSQTKQKMSESRLSTDIVPSESKKEQELGSVSKTELQPSKRGRRKITLQKKTSPTSPPRSRFSHSSLSAHSLVKSRKAWIRRYPKRASRKENAGKEAEVPDVSVETGSEASEEALIEHYESNPDSRDEISPSKPQEQSPEGRGDKPEENQSSDNEDDREHQESPLSNHEGDRKTGKNMEDGQSDKRPEECDPHENERENEPEEEQSRESKNEPCGDDESENKSQEMDTKKDKNSINEIGLSEELSGSQGFEPAFSEKGTKLAVPSGAEEDAAACASLSDTAAHSETEMTVDQSEDIFGDSAAEAISEPSTTSVIHIAHCGGTAYTEGEGSLDMFEDGPGSSPISSPFLQPFHGDSNDCMNDDRDSDAVESAFSEELLESDFPHNQRGLEMEQESLTPAEENEFVIDTTEDQESVNTEESTEQSNTQSAQRSPNSQETSSNLSTDDQVQETAPEETVEKLPLRTETSPEKTVEKLPLRKETSPEKTVEKLPLKMETSSEETVEKLPLKTKTSSEETSEKLQVLQGRKLSKAELFMLLDQSDASTQEIIDYLQSRQRRKRPHHAVPGSEEDNAGTSCKKQKLDSGAQGPESLIHGHSPEDLSTDASVVSVDAMSCDEVDCPVSDSHAAAAVNAMQNVNKKSCSSANDAVSCITSKCTSTSDSTSNASSTSSSAVSAVGPSGISSAQDSEDGCTEEGEFQSCCKDSEETSVNSCVSARSGSSHRPVPVSESPAEIISTAVHSEPSTSSATESSEPCSSSRALASSPRPESLDEAHRVASEKQCEGAQDKVSQDLTEGSLSGASETLSRTTVSADAPLTSTSEALESSLQPALISSPGILKKRIPDSPVETPMETPSSTKKVSFANPIEVGGTPTCADCGGIPSCEKCRKPESEERKRPFRDSPAFRKRKERLRKSRLRLKHRLDEEASNRVLRQSSSSSLNEQSASTSQNASVSKTRLSSRDMQSPSTSTNVQSGGSCSRNSQGPSTSRETRSPQNSETQSTNSYHSTQESQLDSVNAVFPDLVKCTDLLDSILPSITASVLCRGMHGLLLARSISTVGHLASLTECEVEKLPFMAPKTKTLKNALKNYQLKHQPPKAADKPAESGLQCCEEDRGKEQREEQRELGSSC